MSRAWRQQAIPLLTTEIVLSALQIDNPEAAELNRVCARAHKWAEACWGPLQQTKVQQKPVQKRLDRIHDVLDREFDAHGVDVTAMSNMLLYLVEAVGDQVPEDRKHPWKWLAVAVDDFSLLVDPDRDNDEAIDRGLNIGQQIQNIAQ